MKQRLRLILLLTAGLLGLVIVPAYADSLLGGTQVAKTPASELTNVVSKTLADTVGEQQQTLNYWTPQRIQKAAPTPLAVADPNTADGLLKNVLPNPAAGGLPIDAVKGKIPALAGQTQPADQSATQDAPVTPVKRRQKTAPASTGNARAAVWKSGGKVVANTGKVFYTLKGQDYVATASVVKSANRDTVITAGHVVNEGPGEYATNWTFFPGWNDGSEPYGGWTARKLITTSAWAQKGDLNQDVGFAVLNTRNRRHVADVVGAQNIAFNSGKGTRVYSFGYPLYAPYDGKQLHFCSDVTRSDSHPDSTDIAITCPMTEGASGGQMVTGMKSNEAGTVISVNSFSYDDSLDVMMGPAFGNSVKSVYNSAQRA